MLLELNMAIDKLMKNDRNATWDECETLEEVREGLVEAIKGYDVEEETYRFYNEILNSLQA